MSDQNRTFPLLFLSLLLLIGGGLFSSSGVNPYLARLLLLAGAASLIFVAIRSGSELKFLLFRIRTVSEPGPAFTWLLIGALLLVSSAIFSIEGQRYDFTRRNLNSLTETSLGALDHLTGKVEMIAAYRETAPIRDTVKEMLAVYKAGSPRVETELFDPERDPDRARQYGFTRPDQVLIRTAEAREFIEDIDEGTITQAILRVGDPRRPTVGIVTGHGELGDEREGLIKFRTLLIEAGFRIRTLRLGELVGVPDALSILVVAGPQTALAPGEVQLLDSFLDQGGRAALFLEPEIETGLAQMLKRRGLIVDGRRVRDESPLTRSLDLGPEMIAIDKMSGHDVVRRFSSGSVLAGATGIRVSDRPVWGSNGNNLMFSGERAFFLDSESGSASGPPGVVALGAALEWEVTQSGEKKSGLPVAEKPYARIVAVGDSDFLRDETLGLYGNTELASRIIGWLGEREFLLRFPPVDRGGTPLRIGTSGLRTVFYLVQIILPLILYILGFVMWMRRR